MGKWFTCCIALAALLGLTLVGGSAFAQQKWTRTYGGVGYDDGISVQQTSDGGYILAGSTGSFGAGESDVYLIKIDASGDTLWTRTFGGPDYDYGWSVQQTQDGGYIVAGYTFSFGAGATDVYLIKTNASGGALWSRTYGGPSDDRSYSVRQTSDGGYIIAGVTLSYGAGNLDVWLIKTNASGDTLWTRTFGGTNHDYSRYVQQTSDGGYIVAGYTMSFGAGGRDVYLIKTNASGDTLWTRTYGGTNDDWCWAAQQTQDGGYILAGYISYSRTADVYLLKTNASGDTLWSRTYGGADLDYGRSVRQTQDGGYILAGLTASFGAGDYDVYLLKTNASGDTLWTRTYGGTSYDEGFSVRQTQDGGYIITGLTTSFGAGDFDVYLIKTDAEGSSAVEAENKGFEGPRVQGIKITPNPFVSFATVPGHEREAFSLYDVSGRKVGTCSGSRIGEGLKAGVYFLQAEGRKEAHLRIVKVR